MLIGLLIVQKDVIKHTRVDKTQHIKHTSAWTTTDMKYCLAFQCIHFRQLDR